MSMVHETLSSPKAILVNRSQLGRLRLRREVRAVSDSLRFRRAIVAVAATPAAHRIAFAMFLAIAGPRRTGRVLLLAGRVVFFASLARTLLTFTRNPERKNP